MTCKIINAPMLVRVVVFFLWGWITAITPETFANPSQRQMNSLPDIDISTIERVIVFTISNHGDRSVVVKNITIDGTVYLNHEMEIKPYDLSIISKLSVSEAASYGRHSFIVLNKDVNFFEMIVNDGEKDRTYSCELIATNELMQDFDVRVGDGSFVSPLKSITMLDDGAEYLNRKLERLYDRND